MMTSFVIAVALVGQYPSPQAPAKNMPVPQAPMKTMPTPQAPAKTMPTPQAFIVPQPAASYGYSASQSSWSFQSQSSCGTGGCGVAGAAVMPVSACGLGGGCEVGGMAAYQGRTRGLGLFGGGGRGHYKMVEKFRFRR